MPSEIQTNFGKIKLGFSRDFGTHNKNHGVDSLWLEFDKEKDCKCSLAEFKSNSRRMCFILRGANHEHKEFFVYLGDPYKWRNEYVVRLVRKKNEFLRWEAHEDDIERIRGYWCAAEADITLCSEPRQPVLTDFGEPVCTRIQLDHIGWYNDLYNHIRTYLDSLNQQSLITSPFEQIIAITERARTESSGSEASSLYHRIQQLWPHFANSIEDILRNPAERLVRELSFLTLSVTDAQKYFSSVNTQEDLFEVYSAMHNGTHVIPTEFVQPQSYLTYDIPENHLVVQCLGRVEQHMKRVEQELSRYIEYSDEHIRSIKPGKYHTPLKLKHDRHVEELESLKYEVQRCQQYRRKFNFLDSTKYEPGQKESELFYYDQRYANVRRLTAQIIKLVDYIDTSAETMKFRVAPFHEFYQHWCLVKIVRALESLGFIDTNNDRQGYTPFYQMPQFNTEFCSMTHSGFPSMRLSILYERRYPFSTDANKIQDYGYEARRNKTSYPCNDPKKMKSTPDISLEFWGLSRDEYPSIITLDPTMANDLKYCQEKYLYRDSLRHFIEEDDNGESQRIVKAAWAICPGINGPAKKPYTDAGPRFSQGILFLNHLSDSQMRLQQTLSRIFVETKMFPEDFLLTNLLSSK